MSEQIKILETIIASIMSNPSQFHYRVEAMIIGVQGTANNGGAGVVGIANAPHSVGIQGSASISDVKIRIAEEKANYEIMERQKKILELLNQLKDEASKEKPDENIFKTILQKCVSLVPDSIIAILRLILIGG